MFVAYLLCYPDGRPFYAGAGQAGREYLLNKRNSCCREIVDKIIADDECVLSIVLEYENEVDTFDQELVWITEYGRLSDGGLLTNCVIGRSGGILGIRRSEEHKEHMRKMSSGRVHSAETRAKMSKSRLGNKNRLGYVYSDEERKVRSEQTRLGIARARARREGRDA